MEKQTLSVTLTVQEALKYYRRGGTLKEIALKACPNIEDLLRANKIIEAKEEYIQREKLLKSVREYFTKGKIFEFCNNNGYYYALKIVSDAQFCPKYKKRIYCDIICFTREGKILEKGLVIQVPSSANSLSIEKATCSVTYHSTKASGELLGYLITINGFIKPGNIESLKKSIKKDNDNDIKDKERSLKKLIEQINEKKAKKEAMLIDIVKFAN